MLRRVALLVLVACDGMAAARRFLAWVAARLQARLAGA
jgi:hypothetical protein